MLDWKPGRSLLGFLTVKTAQDAASGATPNNPGFNTPEQQPGVMTGGQLAATAAGTLGGEDLGGVFQALIPVLQPYFAARGINLAKPYQIQYGGSADDARALSQIQQTVLVPSMISAGKSAIRSMGALGGVASKLTNGAIPPDLVQKIYAMIPGDQNKDLILGQVMSTLAQSDPQLKSVMQTLDPGAVFDWNPLIKATYARNGGKFNPADFVQLKDTFEQMHAGGHFRGIPAQSAIEAVPYAMQVAGPNATSTQISNLALVGSEILARHMAPTLGAGMEMAAGLGNPQRVLSDPRGAMAEIEQLHQYVKQIPNMDPGQAYAAVQLARQKGLSPVALLESMGAGGQAARALTGGAETQQAKDIASGAADAYSRVGTSDSMKALAALKGTSPAWDRSIDRLISTGDIAGLNRVTDQAMRNPQLWRRMQSADTSELVQAIGERPGLLAGVMNGEVQRYARLTNNPELGSLVANPKEVARRLHQGDFSGLSDRTVAALMPNGPTGGRLAGALLASQEALRSVGYRGTGRLPDQKAVPWTKPLDRPVDSGASVPTGAIPSLPSAPVQAGAPWTDDPAHEVAQQSAPAPVPAAAPARTVRPFVPPTAAPAPTPAVAAVPAPAAPAPTAPPRTVRPFVPKPPPSVAAAAP